MWNRNKSKYKKAMELWNTRKPNGARMYQKKEIVEMIGVDRKTLFSWFKLYDKLVLDNTKTQD